MTVTAVRTDPLWAGVDAVIDRAPSLRDLRAHRLQLLAARRWRGLGREVPDDLLEEEIRATWIQASVRAALETAVATSDGPVLVLKGPHTASFYEDPELRPFNDLDLLALDPGRLHAALVDAGFAPIGYDDGYYRGLHHLRPLLAPGGRVAVEVHRHPNWLRWSEPPPVRELLDAAEPDVLGVPGLLGLRPAHHALVLAAHAWVELPFRRLLDLVDVAAVARESDPAVLDALARRWHMGRLWQATIAAADAMFSGAPESSALRAIARNFPEVRDRTVQETHIRRLTGDFWARPALPALGGLVAALGRTLAPAPSDTLGSKTNRTLSAIRNRSQPSSEHAELLGDDARRPPRFRRR